MKERGRKKEKEKEREGARDRVVENEKKDH